VCCLSTAVVISGEERIFCFVAVQVRPGVVRRKRKGLTLTKGSSVA
jgi:hypothetical protein